ncbi:MAG: DUF5681 domain-containing protein [Pseudomonadota bacterium]
MAVANGRQATAAAPTAGGLIVDGSDDDREIGYKRPPRHSRFQKGRSGNPRGRPRGSGVRSAAEKVLDRLVTATVDGEVPLPGARWAEGLGTQRRTAENSRNWRT